MRESADTLDSPAISVSGDQLVLSPAVGAFGLAGLFDGQEHPRMGVPLAHAGHGAVERQVLGGNLVALLRVGGLGSFLLGSGHVDLGTLYRRGGDYTNHSWRGAASGPPSSPSVSFHRARTRARAGSASPGGMRAERPSRVSRCTRRRKSR